METSFKNHPLVWITNYTIWEGMNSSPGLLAITGGCILLGFFSGLFTYTLIELAEITMNTIPDFDIVEIDDLMLWWKGVRDGSDGSDGGGGDAAAH